MRIGQGLAVTTVVTGWSWDIGHLHQTCRTDGTPDPVHRHRMTRIYVQHGMTWIWIARLCPGISDHSAALPALDSRELSSSWVLQRFVSRAVGVRSTGPPCRVRPGRRSVRRRPLVGSAPVRRQGGEETHGCPSADAWKGVSKR